MDVNKLIENEYNLVMNESFKKIVGGIALMYALTAPTNQDSFNKNNTEYESNINHEQLKNVMKSVSDKYDDKVKYFKFTSTNPTEDLNRLVGTNPELKDVPYTMFIDSMGMNKTMHVLVGDKQIISSFENKFLKEK